MSRMSAAQVISLGEYLEPEFDPASLTVSQLLGILGYHNIPYPTPYTKPKLIIVFNNEVKTRAAKFKKDRKRNESSVASEDGITDGITGKPLSSSRVPEAPPTARRSSRRLSHAPRAGDSSPTRPEPPKRRRSSAQPNLGGSSRTAIPVPVTLYEESEPEEEEMPVKKVGRTKKQIATAAAERKRRISHISGEDSGWEDKNIFQSGAESSSPARPSPVRPRIPRTSMGPKKSRKSTSAPPEMLDSSPLKFEKIARSPPQSPFRPQRHPTAYNNVVSTPVESPVREPSPPAQSRFHPQRYPMTYDNAISPPVESGSTPARQPSPPPQSRFRPEIRPTAFDIMISPPVESRGTPVRRRSPVEYQKAESPVQSEAEDVQDNQYADVQDAGVEDREAGHAQQVTFNHDKETEIDEAISRLESENASAEELATQYESSSWLQTFGRIIIWFGIVLTSYAFFSYKVESSAIGFCDRASNTSVTLNAILSARAAQEACAKGNLDPSRSENASHNEDNIMNNICPLPPLIPLPHPNSCTPCPDHATCNQFHVTCDHGYLLKPHILLSLVPVSASKTSLATTHVPNLGKSFFQGMSSLTSGIPGFGSVGLPPRCVEDPQRKRNIGALGKAIESMLGRERGRRVCHGERVNVSEVQTGPEAAVKWGVQVDRLRELFRKNASPSLLPIYDDMFNEAIQQLSQWGGVFMSETADGVRYVAHKTPEMTWDCIILVKTRELWAAWRSTVLVSILAILILIGLRLRMTQKQKENKRITGLVQIALDTLRNQEMAHYTDPLTAPQPYLSSIQLRDLVLQDEHSVPTRRRLWERVERIVEGNANVRANLEEIEGGDETRVWRWMGSTGTGRTPARKQIHYEESE